MPLNLTNSYTEMKKILLATDFSDNSRNAITYAVQFFGTDQVEYTLLNTYVEPRSTANVVVSLHDILEKESKESLKKELTFLREKYAEIEIKALSKYGIPAQVIQHITTKSDFDYLVIGTKGSSALENFFMGSNTLDVISKVEVPMLVVPKSWNYDEIQRIAIAADYKHFKQAHLLDPLVAIAAEKKAEVLVFNIDSGETDYEEALEGFELHNTLEKVSHSFHNVNNSDVVAGIEQFVNENKVDLLTIIPRHHHFFDRLFNKSVTREISMLAHVPLLVLHESTK